MPRLSVYFVRTALSWLAVGFTAGALLLWNKAWPLDPMTWRLLPLHMEALFVGWLLQLAAGVAFWILPRWQGERRNERFAWAAYFLINAGIALAAFSPWMPSPAVVLTLARVLELVGAAAFARHAWPRVKPWMEKA